MTPRGLSERLGKLVWVLRPLSSSSAPRNRLLPPERVTSLVCDQGDAHAVKFALDLGPVYRTAAQDARTAGPSMGLQYAIDNGQTRLL